MFTVERKILKKYGKPDIIYASSMYPTALLIGVKLAKKYGIKCISETRDIVPEGFTRNGALRENGLISKFLRAFMKYVYTRSDALVFTMSGGKQYIQDRGWSTAQGGKIDLDRVYYINNGVDLNVFRENQGKCIVEDKDLDNPNLFKVIYLGAIRFMNKMPLFFDIARELNKKGRHDIKILMWGSGTKIDEMRQQLQNEGLDNLVLKGYVEKKYIPSIATRGHLAILTANLSCVDRYGASPNKLFDYLAAGLPVIVPSLLSDGLIMDNGIGLELDQPSGEEMADAIIRFADMDKDEYNSYCENSRKMAARFSYEALSKELEKAITDVLKG